MTCVHPQLITSRILESDNVIQQRHRVKGRDKNSENQSELCVRGQNTEIQYLPAKAGNDTGLCYSNGQPVSFPATAVSIHFQNDSIPHTLKNLLLIVIVLLILSNTFTYLSKSLSKILLSITWYYLVLLTITYLIHF